MLLLNGEVQSLEESSAKVANIQQVIMAINALSKVFSLALIYISLSGDNWKYSLFLNHAEVQNHSCIGNFHPWLERFHLRIYWHSTPSSVFSVSLNSINIVVATSLIWSQFDVLFSLAPPI